jgi:hypothetical protein
MEQVNSGRKFKIENSSIIRQGWNLLEFQNGDVAVEFISVAGRQILPSKNAGDKCGRRRPFARNQ